VLTIHPDGSYDLYNDGLNVEDRGALNLTRRTWTMNSYTPGTPVARNMAVQGCDWQYQETDIATSLFFCRASFSYVKY
jgi:hypothetical protein